MTFRRWVDGIVISSVHILGCNLVHTCTSKAHTVLHRKVWGEERGIGCHSFCWGSSCHCVALFSHCLLFPGWSVLVVCISLDCMAQKMFVLSTQGVYREFGSWATALSAEPKTEPILQAQQSWALPARRSCGWDKVGHSYEIFPIGYRVCCRHMHPRQG